MEMTTHPTEVARQEGRSLMSSATPPPIALRNVTREEGYNPLRARLAIFSRARLMITGQAKKGETEHLSYIASCCFLNLI